MTTLLLIRHATTAATGVKLGGRTAASLDERGRGQAQAAAERLAALPIKAIYASPLPRTQETAEIVAAPHRREVLPLEGVLEIEYGDWTDRSLKSLYRNKRWPLVQHVPSRVQFPGGESLRAAQARAVDAIEDVAGRHRRQLVAVVTHADVIKLAVAFYAGMPLDSYQRLHVGPASVSMLALGDGRPTLLRFNDEGPLTAEQFKRPRKAKK